jgi:hypothetical protein
MLRVIQLNTLEDRSVNEKQHWDSAVKFLENSVKEKLQVQCLGTLGTYAAKKYRYFFAAYVGC